MKYIFSRIFILVVFFSLFSCNKEIQIHTVKGPTLELTSIGPMFEGSNTATVTWEYALEDLIPQFTSETQIDNVRIVSLKIEPLADFDYPEIGKIVMELKPGDFSMSRVGLLENNFNSSSINELLVAEIQEDFNEGFNQGRLTFVADFDLKEEEFYDDIAFKLDVVFEIKTK